MKTQSSKTASVLNLLARGQASDSAPAIPNTEITCVDTERTIETITGEILEAKRVGGEAILTIGNGLIEAKALLSHGEWLSWLSEKVEFSERTAQNFMRIAREMSNPQLVADLGVRRALVLLALPESERDAFMAGTHTVDGEEKTVIDMSARELEKAIRDRKQALADKAVAEESRAKMEQDMTMVKQLLETAQEERDTALQEAEESQGLLQASEFEITRLSQELEELKKRPVEVAVQTVVDQEAVAKARAEGEAAKAAELAALQKKLDRAKAEKDKLTAARDEAEARQKTAEAELATVRAKLEAAVLAEQRAEKKSAIAGDKDLSLFQVYFDHVQEISNKMQGLLLKVRGRGDKTTANGMENAIRALAEKIGGIAG